MIAHFTSVHLADDTRIYHRQLASLGQHFKEVYYFCPEPPEKNDYPDLNIFKLNLPSNKFFRVLFAWITCSLTLKKFKKIKIVQFHDPELLLFGVVARLMRKKVIYDKHEDVQNQIQNKAWIPQSVRPFLGYGYHYSERICSYFFNTIITVTPPIADKLSFHPNVHLIRNFPIKDELVVSSAQPYEERENIVFYVGEASVERGLQSILEGVLNSKLTKKFILIGRIVPPDFLSAYKNHPDFSKIIALGQQNRETVKKYINQAKVGLIMIPDRPNFRIGYPNKIFEYMAVKLPIVASDLPNLRHFITDNNCGICVDQTDYKAIGSAIDSILENTKKAKQMGQNGRDLVDMKYSWEVDEDKFIQLIRNLLSGTAN